MKTKICLIVLAIILIAQMSSLSQTISPLPYFNDFEDSVQNVSWAEFQQGYLNHHWYFQNSNDQFNTTGCLAANDYVWDCNATPSINWITSPPIDFTGASYLSLSAKVSVGGSGGAVTQLGIDHKIKAFVLVGSNNPDSAMEVIEIANLVGLFTGNDHGGSSIWKDTMNIFIPPISGLTFLAFKYTGGNDFHVKIDNINIANNMTATALTEIYKNNDVHIFPNPSVDCIQFDNLPSDKIFNLTIYSSTGALVFLQKRINSEKIPLDLPIGFYTYKLEDEKFNVLKSGKLIVSNAL